MRGLVPGIHANATGPVFAWMAGSGPAMTERAQEPPTVMPALEAGIHANATWVMFAWMAGSRPAMTEGAVPSQGVGVFAWMAGSGPAMTERVQEPPTVMPALVAGIHANATR